MNKHLSHLKIIALLLTAVIINSCSDSIETTSSFETKANEVVISLTDSSITKKIRLQVLNENIIRVSATPTSSFSSKESLMAIARKNDFTDFTVSEKEGVIIVSTSKISAEVIVKTGAIIFKDAQGNVLLAEKNEGGKSFSPSYSNEKGLYTIRQTFDSPDDEAFYGLGQHQHGYMNYKGKDVDLAQHNLAAVVPFLYSNKNYGILWDNYSITKFGDPRDYEQLSSMKLFNAEDEEGGLTTTYYEGENIVNTQIEDNINFQYLETKSYESLPKTITKVVWEGAISSDTPGIHKFLLYASSYFKLWIDGELVMDKWRQNWNPWSNPFNIAIENGEKHNIKVEWLPQGGYMSVTHLDPLPGNEQTQLSLTSEAGQQIDYYFVYGENADKIISGYRTITGKAPIVPKWAMGFWQSRERYKTQEEILDVVTTFRKKKIPLDNIVLDWNYWSEDQWGSHEFDSTRFPDPTTMNKKLHDELHTNIMISVWPKYYEGIKHYNEMDEKGYLFKRNIEKERVDWIGQGYHNTFYDSFNKGAREMFWEQLDEHLYSKGFDAWWLDATEPDMHSNLSIAERKLNMTPTALGSGEEYFNGFSLMNSKGIYEGQRKDHPEKRVFILTRSAYAGQQHYGAVTWSGDVVSRWSDLRDQISAGVNFSLSGIPYWTMDIGGFALENRYGAYGDKPTKEDLDEWRELNTRWFQFGVFCPIFRVHGQYPFREVFNLAPEEHAAYKSMLYYNKLRYRLMPYIYSLAGKSYHDDYTIMRGLVMDFGTDEKVLNIDNQFMFGPSLLINPVIKFKATEREVYLPSGTSWYNFYTGEYNEGGQTINTSAEYEKIPVFVKAGSIIPVGPELQYTNEVPDSVITLFVYGGADASFELYDDEATNYNYEKGAFSKTPISYSESNRTITIGKREGSFDGMLATQTFNIIFINKNTPIGFAPLTKPNFSLQYMGEEISISIQ